MLAINYHVSMPAMMGFMLLSGIIVNNAILLIHFALEKMREGITRERRCWSDKRLELDQVLRRHCRLLLECYPVAQGSCYRSERLAPLGAVAIWWACSWNSNDSSIYSCLVYLVCEGGLNSLA